MSATADPKPLSAPAERPLPSDRFDAAQARLQAEAAASVPVKAKRSKNPAYHVLKYHVDLSAWERLTVRSQRPPGRTRSRRSRPSLLPLTALRLNGSW